MIVPRSNLFRVNVSIREIGVRGAMRLGIEIATKDEWLFIVVVEELFCPKEHVMRLT
jgi:hypothetical protein